MAQAIVNGEYGAYAVAPRWDAAFGWDINNPVELKKTAPFVFEYDGALNAGDFKACCAKGSWDVPFVRPAVEGVTITTTGVSAPEFVFVANPDNKWKVTDAGMYHLTFDLQSYTFKAEYKGEIKNEKEPISTETFYIVGDATPGCWSMDAATACTKVADYKFTLAVELVEGSFKAMVKPDNTFSCPFFRPAAAGVTVGENGASLADCVYTRNPDDQWRDLQLATLGIKGEYKVRDLWAHADEGTASTLTANVPAHGCKIVRLSK